jgi:hypothetical protein
MITTVVACGVVIPILVSGWVSTARSAYRSQADAKADSAARVSRFVGALTTSYPAGLPDDATIRRMAESFEVLVASIQRGATVTIMLASGEAYGFGLDGQAVRVCYRATFSAPGDRPVLDLMPESQCVFVPPNPSGSPPPSP